MILMTIHILLYCRKLNPNHNTLKPYQDCLWVVLLKIIEHSNMQLMQDHHGLQIHKH